MNEDFDIDALINEGINKLETARKINLLGAIDSEIDRLETILKNDSDIKLKTNAAGLVVHAFSTCRKLNKELDELTKK